MTRDISNTADYLDVRDIIERFEELEGERNDLHETQEEARAAVADAQGELEECPHEADEPSETLYTTRDAALKVFDAARNALDDWDEENAEEFKSLKALLGELEGNGGDHQWKGEWYPVTLIRDSYFVEAMQELVQDIGDLPKNIPAYLEIDWDKTADNLRADYSSAEYDGVTFWFR